MTYLTRYEPFRAVRREFDRLFEDLLPSLQEENPAMWMPRLDLSETDGAFLARMDLPGLKPEDVHVDLQNNRLTVRGERKDEARTEDENTLRVERAYGSFLRTLTLPANVRPDDIEATFEDGVLTVRLPKTEESQPKRIEVHAAGEPEPA
jgi:HSP20 family protein